MSNYELHPSNHLFSLADISDYLNNEMPQEKLEQFKNHLQKCVICKTTISKIADMDAIHEMILPIRKEHLDSDKIKEYVSLSVSENEKQQIETHLNSCEHCNEAVKLYKAYFDRTLMDIVVGKQRDITTESINIRPLKEMSLKCSKTYGVNEKDFERTWDILEHLGCIGSQITFSESEVGIGHTFVGPDTVPSIQAVIIAITTDLLFEIVEYGYQAVVEKISTDANLESTMSGKIGVRKQEVGLNFSKVTHQVMTFIKRYIVDAEDNDKTQ